MLKFVREENKPDKKMTAAETTCVHGIETLLALYERQLDHGRRNFVPSSD